MTVKPTRKSVFNQKVMSIRQNCFLVDLIWETGNLVIEVDGYQFHSNRTSFMSDRQRDYELLISGYRVLRLDVNGGRKGSEKSE